jgi:NAD(P)-dependent dehydrogenase (short-subunit alcohol dehydrogenase family)
MGDRRPLEGRTIILTGAGSRQGLQHALVLAGAGANLVLNESAGESWHEGAPERLAATLAAVEAAGHQAVGCTYDVADWEGARALTDLAVRQFGVLHGLYNNAGNTADRTIAKMSQAEWRAAVATCMDAAFYALHFALEYWRTLPDPSTLAPRVLSRTSSSSILAQPGQANYVSAMDAIVGITRTAAREGERIGMKANAICGPLDEQALLAITASRGKNRPSAEEAAARSPKHDSQHLAPFAAYLLSEGCDVSGRVFLAQLRHLRVYEPWHLVAESEFEGPWDIPHMGSYVGRLVK